MQNRTSRTALRVTALLILLAWGGGAEAATRVWSGAVNGSWGTAKNWVGGVAPRAVDDLYFPANAPVLSVSNTVSLSFGIIQIDGPYVISGNPILAKGVVGAAETGVASILNKLILQPNGTIGVAVELSLQLKGPVVLGAGQSTFQGGLGLQFFDSISGPAGITVREGFVQFRDTNSYQGPTIVENAGILELTRIAGSLDATLGATAGTTTVMPGGTLRLRAIQKVSESLLLHGRGAMSRVGGIPYGQGALQVMPPSEVALTEPLRVGTDASVQVGAFAAVTDNSHLTVTDLIPEPGAADVRLTKLGAGTLGLRSPTNRIAVPLHVAEGQFFLVDSILPRPDFWPPNFEADLVVGGTTNRFFPPNNTALADLSLPFNFRPNAAPPSRVLGDQVSVTVLNGGRVIFGPVQSGLGTPLRLNLGTVDLWDPNGVAGPRAVGTHRGLVEIDGVGISKIRGKFGLDGVVTIRALNPRAVLRFENGFLAGGGGILGDTLEVDGGTVTFATTTANRFTNLVVLTGAVTAEPVVASFAQFNIVGSPESEVPASLTISQSGQVSPSNSFEVRRNGTLKFTAPATANLQRLFLNGGRLEPRKLTVVSAEFAGDSVVRLAPENPLDVPLTIQGPDWTWNGTVTAEVAIPEPPVNNSKFVLVRWNGSGPFPGRFQGLPDGERILLGTASARVNYAGGDGNDLEIRILPDQPTSPNPPSVSTTPEGKVILSWPEAAACQLEFRTNLDPSTAWVPVETPAASNGEVRLEIDPGTAGAIGYYRLGCP